ncbi:hypothetical protein [Streptomyces botrytidirepellens]|uniref:Uncharacterized protein n=1 Tax=Streptomyces botrytidirepellens TaxID=2486417 RepID=A0A3M8WCG2_9ACTN|nr:hypothetical protein [Streptomyces botrytidirepellens]RNG27762.1 hypothetical protein EEJ42_13020 [Streptomyces botrytidirepellens]
MEFDPFTADEASDYAEICATYTTTLGELAAAAEREHQQLRGIPRADRSMFPLVFPVDHEFVVHINVPVDVVRELEARHAHPGAPDEQLTIDSGGLIIMGCGERFVTDGDDKVISQEEWKALVAKRNA